MLDFIKRKVTCFYEYYPSQRFHIPNLGVTRFVQTDDDIPSVTDSNDWGIKAKRMKKLPNGEFDCL